MEKHKNSKVIVAVVFVWFAMGLAVRTASAQDQAAISSPHKQQLADSDVKRLLLLMDTDKNGRISKQEWMTFMEKEFDRLDTDKSGELDPKELSRSKVQISNFSSVGK